MQIKASVVRVKYARVGLGVGFWGSHHIVQKRRKPKTRWGSGIFLGATFLLRCPVCALATVRLRCTPTAATRSGRSSRYWRRSPHSPNFHWLRQFKSVSANKKSAIPVGMTDFLELLARFELATSSLPRMRSTG